MGCTDQAGMGVGNHGMAASSSGKHHNVNAGPAPNARRMGLRSNNTIASPSVVASSICSSIAFMSAPFSFDGIDQLAQFRNVLRG
ncbi:hypothetical protein GCM10007862_18810 [Dyella lipolytica]|nr:hypothetical protein GCM10007862_18810 [Dyella lipolytica]